jgi:hypothetical protein
MPQELNLKEIERKAWKSVFQDGLYDLWLGGIILWLGAIYLMIKMDVSVADRTVLSVGVVLGSLVLLYLAKRFIIAPRSGWVEFGRGRKIRLFLTSGLIFGFVVMLGFILMVPPDPNQVEQVRPLAEKMLTSFWVCVFLQAIFSLSAYVLEYKRLHWIGLIFAVAIFCKVTFKDLWGLQLGVWTFVLPALLVMVLGAFTLWRFLREHPIPDLEYPVREERWIREGHDDGKK